MNHKPLNYLFQTVVTDYDGTLAERRIFIARHGSRLDFEDPGYAPRRKARYGETGAQALQGSGDTVLQLVQDFSGNLALFGHGASLLGGVAGLLHTDPESLKVEGMTDPPPSCTAEVVLIGRKWRLQSVRDFCAD